MSPGRLAATCVAVLLSVTGAAARAQDSARPPGAPAAPAKPAVGISVPQLEQALAKNPDDPKVNVALGVAYLERGDARPRARAAAARREGGPRFRRRPQLARRRAARPGRLSRGHRVAAEGDRARPEEHAGVREPRVRRSPRAAISTRPSTVFRKALALDPDEPAARTSTWAWPCAKRATSPAALPHLRRVAEADPGNASAALRARAGPAPERRARAERSRRSSARSSSIQSCARRTTRSGPP